MLIAKNVRGINELFRNKYVWNSNRHIDANFIVPTNVNKINYDSSERRLIYICGCVCAIKLATVDCSKMKYLPIFD